MKTQIRILVIISALALLSLAGFAVFQIQDSKRMDMFQSIRTEDEKQALTNLISMRSERQRILAYDYSWWGEMVDFVTSRDPVWAEVNIVEGMESYSVNAAWVLTPDLKLIYSYIQPELDPSSQTALLPNDFSAILRTSHFNHFFRNTPIGLMEFYTAPIQPSDGSPRSTPPQGFFITGVV